MNHWINESESMNQWCQCESIHESVSQWFNDSIESVNQKNQWIDQSTNQRISDAMKHWRDESMNPESMTQWSSESANPWINEIINASMNRWINGSMNQWMSEAMNRRINEWTGGKMNEWADSEWGTSLLSYFWTERPLRSTISSLSYFFSEHSLVWDTSSLSCNPSLFFAQRSHGDFTTQIRGRSGRLSFLHFFFCKIELSLALFRPHLSKVLQSLQFLNTFKRKWSSRYSPVRFLSTTFPDRGPQRPKHRPYFCDPQPRCPKKRTVPAPRVFALVNSHASELLTSQLLDDGWLTWWCAWHDDAVDMMAEMLTMTTVRTRKFFN
jgi:hypothetical protein